MGSRCNFSFKSVKCVRRATMKFSKTTKGKQTSQPILIHASKYTQAPAHDLAMSINDGGLLGCPNLAQSTKSLLISVIRLYEDKFPLHRILFTAIHFLRYFGSIKNTLSNDGNRLETGNDVHDDRLEGHDAAEAEINASYKRYQDSH